MNVDDILVIIVCLSGIIFTYWFFLMKKEIVTDVSSGAVDVIVKGGYKPEVISIPKNKKTDITFIRKDSSSCLEEVVISDFRIRKYLPVNEKVTVSITPKETGEYGFSCGMNMFHGKIIVT